MFWPASSGDLENESVPMAEGELSLRREQYNQWDAISILSTELHSLVAILNVVAEPRHRYHSTRTLILIVWSSPILAFPRRKLHSPSMSIVDTHLMPTLLFTTFLHIYPGHCTWEGQSGPPEKENNLTSPISEKLWREQRILRFAMKSHRTEPPVV